MEKELEEVKSNEQQAVQELEAEIAARTEIENEFQQKETEMLEQLQEADATNQDLLKQVEELQQQLEVHGAPETELQQ